MSYSTKSGVVPSYAQVYSDTNQTVTFFNLVTFDTIQNNTADITLPGAPTTNINVATAGTYKIDFVLRMAANNNI